MPPNIQRPFRVNLGNGEPFSASPLYYPNEQTSPDRADWAVSCQFRKLPKWMLRKQQLPRLETRKVLVVTLYIFRYFYAVMALRTRLPVGPRSR
jgi:hypothetical protein